MHQEQLAFRALADPTRRAILHRLADSPLSVAEVVQHFEISRPAIKKHLVILEDGGLITVATSGRERINSLAPDGLAVAANWLAGFDRFWTSRLDALGKASETAAAKQHNTPTGDTVK